MVKGKGGSGQYRYLVNRATSYGVSVTTGLKGATDRGAVFLEKLKTAEIRAKTLEQFLRRFQTDDSSVIRADLDKSTDAVAQSCAACHKIYRDPISP